MRRIENGLMPHHKRILLALSEGPMDPYPMLSLALAVRKQPTRNDSGSHSMRMRELMNWGLIERHPVHPRSVHLTDRGRGYVAAGTFGWADVRLGAWS